MVEKYTMQWMWCSLSLCLCFSLLIWNKIRIVLPLPSQSRTSCIYHGTSLQEGNQFTLLNCKVTVFFGMEELVMCFSWVTGYLAWYGAEDSISPFSLILKTSYSLNSLNEEQKEYSSTLITVFCKSVVFFKDLWKHTNSNYAFFSI